MLLPATVLALFIYFAHKYIRYRRSRSAHSAWRYPAITPHSCAHFRELSTPRYRPFKAKHFVTMGLRAMGWDEWMELDAHFPRYHKIKAARIVSRQKDLVITLPKGDKAPSGELAARELLYDICEFLSRRYPQIYKVSRKPPRPSDFGWYGAGEIASIEIAPLSLQYDLKEHDPLNLVTLLVQEDVAILIKGYDGQYYCQAGSVCIPGSWKLKDKIGKSLDEIHISGGVPQYAERLQRSMNRFFNKLSVDAPIERHNFTFQVIAPRGAPIDPLDPDELAWSTTTLGPEDPSLDPKEVDERNVSFEIDQVVFRTERQTLRRLPRSGAIVFTIKPYLVSARDLCDEPDVPERLASDIRSMTDDILEYKQAKKWMPPLLTHLNDRLLELRQMVSKSPSETPET